MSNQLGLAARDVDPRSHSHLLTDLVTSRTMLATAVAQTGTVLSTVMKARFGLGRRHRQWQSGDQGPRPYCTAYGTVTLMECGPVTVKKNNLFSIADDLFLEIQAIDRAEDRYYTEGATTLAAMKAAQARGWCGSYTWEFEKLEPAHAFLVSTGPFIAGTNWFDSMFSRDAGGVIRITPTARVVGGHLFAISGYDTKLDLWRISQSWGDGFYYIGSPDLERLLHESGEFCFCREYPQSMWKVTA